MEKSPGEDISNPAQVPRRPPRTVTPSGTTKVSAVAGLS